MQRLIEELQDIMEMYKVEIKASADIIEELIHNSTKDTQIKDNYQIIIHSSNIRSSIQAVSLISDAITKYKNPDLDEEMRKYMDRIYKISQIKLDLSKVNY